MKIPNRILSAILSIALLIPTAATTISAVSPDATPSTVAEVTDLSVTFDVTPVYEIGGDSYIKLIFNTDVDQANVEKVQIVSLSTNEALKGKWQGSGQQWQFIPYDIQDATYYTIVVPADFFAVNGLQLGEAVTHTFRTAPGTSKVANSILSIFKSYDCINARPYTESGGLETSTGFSTYASTGANAGWQLDLSKTTNCNIDQNYRLFMLDDIWQDRSYIGKTVRITFTAKASEAGTIQLTLNQRANADSNGNLLIPSEYNYTFNNFPGFSATAGLTTSWQTFSFDFVVTEAMYEQLQYGHTGSNPNIAVGLRFPGFISGVTYKSAQITFNNITVTTTDTVCDITNSDPIFADFEGADLSSANNVTLRFAVENSVSNTVGVYEYNGVALGSKLGDVKVNGQGVYSLDVTDYVKNCAGSPKIALKVENAGATVDIVDTSIMLSLTTADTYEVLPNVSSSVIATNPNASQNGLWISGGQDGFDTSSVKSYVKLSLSGYTGGYAAFLFNATTTGTANVSVYGVSDVNAGQSWTAGNLTAANAPANDIYGGGVNINEVYGNTSLATFKVGAYENTYRVDLTDFAEYMLRQGATEITLVLVTDSNQVTNIKVIDEADPYKISEYDCEYILPEIRQSGFSGLKLNPTDESLQLDLSSITTAPSNTNPNVRMYVLGDVWANESYIGKTIRISFYAKANVAGNIKLSLNQLHVTANNSANDYTYKNFPGLDKTASLTTEWQKITCEFLVTRAMYDQLQYGRTGGVNIPELALGVRFPGFVSGSAYNTSAKIQFRNFVVSEVPEMPIFEEYYDFSTTTPEYDTRGYNNESGNGTQIASKENGELKVDLNKSYNFNANQYVRVAAMQNIFADKATYSGKTFTITFRAKATLAGLMDFSFNKFGTFNTYSYNGTTYTTQYQLTTEYQTFTYEFVAIDDMFTTHASNNLNLAFRFYNGYRIVSDDGKAVIDYKDAIIYIDDIKIIAYDNAGAASVVPTVQNVSVERTFTDVKYDFSSNVPTASSSGYGPQQICSVKNGLFEIDLTKSTNCNANEYVRLNALDSIFADAANLGKTFTISFRAKATQSGLMDLTLNCGTDGTYSYHYGDTYIYRIYYKSQYSLATEYQTYYYTFTVTSDMMTTNATKPMNLALRFYNGFGNGSLYHDAQIYIDDVKVSQEVFANTTTVSVNNAQTTAGTTDLDALTVYDANLPISANLRKTYLSYNLDKYLRIVGAQLKLNLSGANGETVRMYLLEDTDLSADLNYANAPIPVSTLATYSFVAINGENLINLSDICIENAGSKFVLIFAIEKLSGDVQITDHALELQLNLHNYMEDSQKHVAVAPTYNASGNVEFYTCAGCEKLYVKNGENFEEVTYDSIILPPVEYDTRFFSASLNIGKDLTMRYHVKISTGESADDFAVRFTLNDLVVTVTEYTFDDSGKPVFSFCGIAPQLMGDTVVAELLKGNDVMDSNEYSVKEYVADALVIYSNDNNLKQLLADLLNYGAAAQLYIGYKVDELVTDGFDLSAASTAVPTAADFKKTASTSTDPNVKFTASGVRFDYNNRIYVKFTAPSLDGIKVTVNGQELEIEATNQANVYIAYSDAISALHFTELVTFTLSSGGAAVQTLTYTINDYAYAKMGDTPIGRLSLALYRYGKSAVVYDNSK